MRTPFPSLLILSTLLSGDVLAAQCTSADAFEDNDDCEEPAPLVADASALRVSNTDADWYQVVVPARQTLNVAVLYSSAAANLTAALYNHCVSAGFPSGQLAFSATPEDNEHVAWSNPFPFDKSLLLRVEVAESSVGECAAYSVDLETEPIQVTPVGVSFCRTGISSVGVPRIYGSGSASIGANDLTLTSWPVFPQQPGLYYYGPEQDELPFCAAFRCVGGGSVGVFRLPVIFSDGAQIATHAVDLTDPPQPQGLITPGTTWNFQYWFRDPALDPCSFSLTDGLSVTFLP